MEAVRQFSFSKGLFGQNAKSVDDVGIELADRTLGNEDNVKLRFTAQYMQMAAEGKL
jgi:NitT/TauT family transport system substrate-binding protein